MNNLDEAEDEAHILSCQQNSIETEELILKNAPVHDILHGQGHFLFGDQGIPTNL
ncbi:hypothetical protein [Paenibacillus sp. J22TS3]|uniref:hypothetical protein n=1 Tax=Paenibacillus sp. J22TS3 TaxID=2807192 RepID=UPI001B2C1499|nr:hypothetical protein [Paenibacillus sp. J22TS3]GIP19738.1 hypothetical protein J22TS3_00130 [Paenibacillus sp. J22TS3]